MDKKKCCKSCQHLDFYDGYFCSLSESDNFEDFYIEDIENECDCNKNTERVGKFWLFDGAEF